jgi:hypothetical protein
MIALISFLSDLFPCFIEEDTELTQKTLDPTHNNPLITSPPRMTYPIYVNEPLKKLETTLNTEFIFLSESETEMNKARCIHQRLETHDYISQLNTAYHEWTPLEEDPSQALFVYIGFMPKAQLYNAAVLNKDCSYHDQVEENNLATAWKKILTKYDKNGAIQSVILYGKELYELAKSKKCPVLPEGDSLNNIWSKTMEQFNHSEFEYKAIGFGKNIFGEKAYSRASMPSFACILTYDGKYRPHPLAEEKNPMAWLFQNDKFHLIKTTTGEVIKQKDVNFNELTKNGVAYNQIEQ